MNNTANSDWKEVAMLNDFFRGILSVNTPNMAGIKQYESPYAVPIHPTWTVFPPNSVPKRTADTDINDKLKSPIKPSKYTNKSGLSSFFFSNTCEMNNRKIKNFWPIMRNNKKSELRSILGISFINKCICQNEGSNRFYSNKGAGYNTWIMSPPYFQFNHFFFFEI